jgi:hypothetical protein
MVFKESFPERRGHFFGPFWLTLIGVPSGHDNRRPLRPRFEQGAAHSQPIYFVLMLLYDLHASKMRLLFPGSLLNVLLDLS